MSDLEVEFNAIRTACRSTVKLYGGYESAARDLGMSTGTLHGRCKPGDAPFLTLDQVHVLQRDIIADPIAAELSRLALQDAMPHTARPLTEGLKELFVKIQPLQAALIDGHAGAGRKALEDLMVSLHKLQIDLVAGERP